MKKKTIEIDVCYNDYFIEVYTVDPGEMKQIMPDLLDDQKKSFELGDKIFFKKDLNSVSIADHGLGFMFMDVKD